MQYPRQATNVYVENLDDEVCVYDWQQKRMHALNSTAALVWEQCDGQTGPAQMAARLESELNVPNADKLVALSLNRLQKARLLEGATPQTQRTVTRREVLKMAGIGLALLPVVSSIALPSPVRAQSPFCYSDFDAFTSVCGPGGASINGDGDAQGFLTANSCEECYALVQEYADNLNVTLVAVFFGSLQGSEPICFPCFEVAPI